MRSMHRRTASSTKKVVRSLATAGMVAGGGFLFSATALATQSAAPTTDGAAVTGGAFTPYVDASVTPAYDLVAAADRTGVKDFTLAFVTAGDGACEPKWGAGASHAAEAVDDGDLNANDVASQIDDLRAEGGDVRVAFGGAAGKDLATVCSGADELAAAYGKVVDAYRLTKVDFDVEGGVLSDPGAGTLRSRAIAGLQRDHPGLDVSFTLPARSEGLTRAGAGLLRNAKDNGVDFSRVSAVNVMVTGGHGSAERAATAAQAQIRTALGISGSEAWQKTGITPTIGADGVGAVDGEVFTVDDAARLVSFAQEKGAGRLSMRWAARDRPCHGDPAGEAPAASGACSSVDEEPLAFTKVFGAYR